jgi:mRNA-degrading endonuclease RelE of RelBE toxin-antitoxin system
MMSGMMMDHSSHGQNTTHEKNNTEILVKEIITKDYRVVAEIPTVIIDRESFAFLRVYPSNDSTLLSMEGTVTLRDVGNNNVVISSQRFIVSKNQEYEYKFSLHHPSDYRIIFEIESINENILDKPIIAEGLVKFQPMSGHSGDNGGFKLSTPMIIGGVLMVSMMIVMIMAKPF